MARTIGEVRRSQVLSTYGIGSIVDLREHSVMPCGVDEWDQSACPEVTEQDLGGLIARHHLKDSSQVVVLRQPPSSEEGSDHVRPLSVVRFPEFLQCGKCGALGKCNDINSDQRQDVADELHDFVSMKGGVPRCQRTIDGNPCRGEGVPARLLVACYHPDAATEETHPGHIDDFPWFYWVHQGAERTKGCRLSLKSKGESLAIEDLEVSCTCGVAPRRLSGIFGKHGLKGFRCYGCRPWLESRYDAQKCDRPVRAFLRGSTSLWQPVRETIISIPRAADDIGKLLEPHLDGIRTAWEDRRAEAMADGVEPNLGKFLVPKAERLLPRIDPTGKYPVDRYINVLKDLLDGSQDERQRERTDVKLRRHAEIRAIRDNLRVPPLFEAMTDALPTEHGQWGPWIGRVTRIRRLRKVTAMVGFHRLTDIQDSLSGSDAGKPLYAPISREVTPPFFPTLESWGEGIFIELNEESVQDWENRLVDHESWLHVQRIITKSGANESWILKDQKPTARLMLLHTLSHALIRTLGLHCGYSSASLEERLYVCTPDAAQEMGQDPMAGIVICTSTSDTDGSLGGLERMASPSRFFPLLKDALRSLLWCSSDPICSESEGQGTDSLNLAACHACALISETSCELGNRFLDRGLVVPTATNKDLAFFADCPARLDRI